MAIVRFTHTLFVLSISQKRYPATSFGKHFKRSHILLPLSSIGRLRFFPPKHFGTHLWTLRPLCGWMIKSFRFHFHLMSTCFRLIYLRIHSFRFPWRIFMRFACRHKQFHFNWSNDELKLSCFTSNYNQSITKLTLQSSTSRLLWFNIGNAWLWSSNQDLRTNILVSTLFVCVTTFTREHTFCFSRETIM